MMRQDYVPAGKGHVSQRRVYRFGDFAVDPCAWQLFHSGQEVHVEPTVLRLLVFLIENRERLVAKDELLDTVWGETLVSESALTKAVARLRKALGDDSARPEYIETVHSLGYRFVAEVQETGQPVEMPIPDTKVQRGIFVIMALLVCLVLAVGLFHQQLYRLWTQVFGAEELQAVTSLAVLPLKNLTGDSEQDYFVDGLHELLITELSKIDGLAVTSRQSMMHYRGSDKQVPEIGQELSVDALVEGGVLRMGDQVRVSVQLIHAQSDQHLWAEIYDHDLQDVFTLLGEVVVSVADEIEMTLMPDHRKRLESLAPLNPLVNDAYLRGIYYLNSFNPVESRKSLVYFREAVDLEPGFARAWAGISGANLLIAYFGGGPPGEAMLQARNAALTALELDKQLYAAHAALGWVRLFTRDWPGAGDAFEEALRLNPSDAMTHHGYADFLTVTGRPEEGLNHVKRGRLLNPLSPMSNMPVLFHLYMLRQYDEAIEEVHKLLQINPDFPASWLLTQVYWQQGLFEKAIDEYRKTLVSWDDPELLAKLEEGYTEAGPQGAIRAVAAELVERSEVSHVDPFKIASAFAWGGEIEQAFHWLERAVNEGSPEIVYLDMRPEFDIVRDDPRYQDLLHRLGLPWP